MSVKKLLLLGAAGIASVAVSSAALAGGPDVAPAPSYQAVYVEGNVGYAFQNWAGIAGAVVTSNRRGGFTGGVDVGYQWSRYLAAELGWFWLPRARFGGIAGAPRVTSWFAYLAAKMMVPLPWVDNLDLFMKAGISWHRLSARLVGLAATAGTLNLWRPVFAVGLQYTFYQNWMANAQFMFVPGAVSFVNPVPHAYLLTVGLGYKFAI